MANGNTYDVVIAGGGLAGLSLAILLSRQQYSVLVLEKDVYPRHKVCGEYVSMESKPFLMDLGLPVDEMNLPVINNLHLTDVRGNEIKTYLPQGGFGISRYKLDATLAQLAQNAGAEILTKTKVDNIRWNGDHFITHAGKNVYTSKLVCGTWGKRSNMDVKWRRPFIQEKNNALNNYVAVKYHIRYPWPKQVVGLHNFTDGYCGISQVEDGVCCMCYLTTAATLRKNDNDLQQLEHNVVMKNAWLNHIFSNATFLYASPVTISQISFSKKEQLQEHVLLLGDAAGMITPLCGNGMSMAFHSAKIAAELADGFFKGNISRNEMEQRYVAAWKNNFSRRTTLGRIVQSNFGKDRFTSLFIKTMSYTPFLRRALINGTSGKPF